MRGKILLRDIIQFSFRGVFRVGRIKANDEGIIEEETGRRRMTIRTTEDREGGRGGGRGGGR